MKAAHVRLTLGLILLLAAVLRIFYLSEVRTQPDYASPQLDALYHHYWAQAMVTGDWTPPPEVNNPEIRTQPYVRSPLYPFMLALSYGVLGLHPLSPRILQLGIGLLNIWLAFVLGRKWFDERAGLVFAAMMSCYWVLVYYEAELVEVTMVVTLMLLLLWTLGSWVEDLTTKRVLSAGAVLGLLVIARPNTLLVVPLAMGWAWWMNCVRGFDLRLFPVKRMALFGLIVFAVILPVTIRNYVVSKQFVLITSNGGLNLYVGNNPVADGYSGSAPDLQGWTSFDHPQMVRRLGRQVGRDLTYTDAAKEWGNRGMNHVKTFPAQTLALMGRKALLFWSPPEMSVEKEDELVRMSSPVLRRLPLAFPHALGLALVGLGLIVYDQTKRGNSDTSRAVGTVEKRAVLLVLIVLGYFASHLPFTVTGRYRVAIVPPLLLLGAYAVARIWQFLRDKKFLLFAEWVLIGIVALALVSPNYAGYQPNEAKWHLSRGLAFGKQNRIQEAERALRLALDADRKVREAGRLPSVVQASSIHNALGVSMALQGKMAEAEKQFNEALAVNPDSFEAHINLARVHAGRSENDRAVTEYEESLRVRSDSVEAHMELGRLLIQMDEPAVAAKHFRSALEVNPNNTTAAVELQKALVSAEVK